MEEDGILYRDHKILENFMYRFEILLKNYNLTLETVSTLCNFDIDRLNKFYIGKDFITYEEMNFIDIVFIGPFEQAIEVSNLNYDALTNSKLSDN